MILAVKKRGGVKMRREFHVHHPEGDFVLAMYESAGLTINNPGMRRAAAKVLFQKSLGEIDVCMTENNVVYVLSQTYNGTVVKIVRSFGVWHRFDVLVPKKSVYYPKKFSVSAAGNDVYGFFSIEDAKKSALCMMMISKSGEKPVVLSYIRSFDSFGSSCNRAGILCTAFENDSGRLCAVFYDSRKNKSTALSLLDGGGFSKISVHCSDSAFHIVFLRSKTVFYIEIDAKTNLLRSIYDAGIIPEGANISSQLTRNKLMINIISKNETEVIEFNLKTGTRRKTIKENQKREPYEVKQIYENESEIELIV